MAADVLKLIPFVGVNTYQRGLDYWRSGRVRSFEHNTHAGIVSGTVRGHGSAYEVVVGYELGQDGTVGEFGTECDCPVGYECKHGVALALAALTEPTPLFATVPMPTVAPRRVIPLWEKALASLQDTAELVGREHLGLSFDLELDGKRPVTSWQQDEAKIQYLRVRPVHLGKQGKWITTGASWADLQRTYQSDPHYRADHLQTLRAIAKLDPGADRYGYRPTAAWIRIDLMESTAIWDLLDQAHRADLAFITTKGVPVILADEPAVFQVGIRRESGDRPDLVLEPTVLVGGEPVRTDNLVLLGNPAHGLVARVAQRADRGPVPAIVLARFGRRPHPSMVTLLRAGELTVAAADESRFVSHYLADLSRHHQVVAPDAGLSVPEPQPPVLVGVFRPMPDHRTLVGWQWDYRLGDASRQIPLRGDERDRDLDAEQATLHAVSEIARAVPTLRSTDGRLVDAGVLTLAETLELVDAVLPALRARDDVEIIIEGVFPDYRAADEQPLVRLSVTSSASPDWFDLSVDITVDGETVSFAALFAALATDEPVLVLPSGTYFRLDTPEFRQLRTLIVEARSMQDHPGGMRISRYHTDFWTELQSLGVPARQSADWIEHVRSLRGLNDADSEGDDPVADQVPTALDATLRPYQLDGMRWLNLLRRNRLGGILADDMGLGKTVQTLAMMATARAENPEAGPFLVVAPTSVVGNWVSEAARFVPSLRTAAVTATAARRPETLADLAADADILVTSYTLLRLEAADYQTISFSGVLLDEAQAVKNHQSKAFASVKAIDAPFKLAITGTPMENNLMELWALFSLVAPGLFSTPKRFTDYYRTPIEKSSDSERLGQLRRRIRPLMLRRTKEVVAAELPARQEQVLDLELEPGHRKVYDRYLHRERQKVLGLLDNMDGNRFAIFRSLTLLRQASIDPGLVDDAHRDVGSTKLTVLGDLLTDIIGGGHRVLVFSQFTSFLKRVRERLDRDGIGYSYLDGSTRRRGAVLDTFRTGTDPVFLISLKAGGVGLNLTEADYVIILDPWWNPATEAQAVDRAHRIGQTKPVMVYRLVARDTIEDKVMALKTAKAGLFDGVINGAGVDEAATSARISAADIRELLG